MMNRLFCILFLAPQIVCGQASSEYVINTKIKKTIAPEMWGVFFEDINRSADGGVYAELIKNRSFDFPDAFSGWKGTPNSYESNDIYQIMNRSESTPNNPKFLQVEVKAPGIYTIENEGFGGIAVNKGDLLEVTVLYRQEIPGIKCRIELLNTNGRVLASAKFEPIGNEWNNFKEQMSSIDSITDGVLCLTFEGVGKINIDRISLFPVQTWKNRSNGLRKDLVEMLDKIHPGFIRFPGGCIVEGQNMENRYAWKETIGSIDSRKLKFNNWNNAVSERPLQDYYQSFGFGFFEYFQLCSDLKAAPMPIINCGISCQFGAGEVIPLDMMQPYIQDALDLIEFANGNEDSYWGKKRIALGRTESFQIKFIGVGNENWGPQYIERLNQITQAIKSKYPDIKIIAATGYSPNRQFYYMDSALRSTSTDIIDEHYYQKPSWFLMNSGKYDFYERRGPSVFIGEYACHSEGIGSQNNKNTLFCALAEAAFMTVLERNADVVKMAAYAPLFAHVKDWQWTPNLIWFGNRSSYGTPSYYVQRMFSNNKGTESIEIKENGLPISSQDSIWASAAINQIEKELIIKIVNPTNVKKSKLIKLPSTLHIQTNATILKIQ